MASLFNFLLRPSTPRGECLLLKMSWTSVHPSASIGRIHSIAFNKVVVSAFVKPLPCLIDAGGLQLGMVKVIRKTQKTG